MRADLRWVQRQERVSDCDFVCDREDERPVQGELRRQIRFRHGFRRRIVVGKFQTLSDVLDFAYL